jgi:NitT/TauT family transport system substrate-binding protein
VFYAPFYAAHALDAFKAEGIDVSLSRPPDPDQASLGTLEGRADVSWGGPLRLLDHHNRDPDCGLVGFCEVVTRDPFFLLGHTPNPTFRFSDLLDCTLASVIEVPTPWLCLQDDIRRAGIDPAAVNRTADCTMAENVAKLRAGDIDVVQVFEPFVEILVGEGAGHIWYSAATRGPTSYTTLYTTKALAETNPDTLLRMTRAIYRTQKWFHAHDGPEIAEVIGDFFQDLSHEVLAGAITRYKGLGLWGRDPVLSTTGFVRLKCGLLSGGFISRDVPYHECVESRFAEQVMAEDPPAL